MQLLELHTEVAVVLVEEEMKIMSDAPTLVI